MLTRNRPRTLVAEPRRLDGSFFDPGQMGSYLLVEAPSFVG